MNLYGYEFQRELDLIHDGRKGMKWGIRNGPPYPIDKAANNAEEIRNRRKALNSAVELTNRLDDAKTHKDFYEKRLARKEKKLKTYSRKVEKVRNKKEISEKKYKELSRKSEKVFSDFLDKYGEIGLAEYSSSIYGSNMPKEFLEAYNNAVLKKKIRDLLNTNYSELYG